VRKRLFVGSFVQIPQEEVKKVRSTVENLKIEGKWVELHNLHFTYRFIGEVEEEKVPQIVQMLRGRLKGVESFPVKFTGLGTFTSNGLPRVLWIGVESQGVYTVKERVDQALMPFGLPPEREFKPHVTLLRIKKLRRRGKLGELVMKMKNHVFLERTEVSVALIESKLTPQGPIYSVVEEFKLG